MGMGGSSLCPEVLKMTFGHVAGSPELHVLDSTVPAQVAALRDAVDLKQHGGDRVVEVGRHHRAERVPPVLPGRDRRRRSPPSRPDRG